MPPKVTKLLPPVDVKLPGQVVCFIIKGDVNWFQGYEEIFCNEIKVYECYYHGGLMK